MSIHSAGIILYRYNSDNLEVLLIHPGGPFWAKKDEGAWSISKGLIEGTEDVLTTAKREFFEETGFEVDGEFIELGEIVQPSKKIITAFALHYDLDPSKLVSNTFELEWPPKSGKKIQCPEVDKAGWFTVSKAKQKILKGQVEFIDKLLEILKYTPKQNDTDNAEAAYPPTTLFDLLNKK
jgi:predicted NUDIX family NTP pyrophosphohydrolase